ncbi:exo-alpha-sialidase [Ilyomonas limi]|uniref:Exo-alpha-sialidase n=1 Tax=Ilyomonas limi TaxID=2575867 RepID=A0A4U3L6A2_9BACT|nr:sialidase family protein [Ilyomonas limi]TKK69929.1 exo-alpha-sialidase [Ilyomonas limi]
MIKGSFFIAVLLLLIISGSAQEKTVIAAGQMPSITKDSHQNIHVVYGSGDSILYTFSNDKGASFAASQLISILPGLVDYATRGPQIAATNNGVVVIAVNKQGNIFSYIKNTAGKWTKASKVNDTDTTNKEGFLGLSSDSEHTLFAIWLDVRGTHHNQVYGARSVDGGKSWQKNVLIYASPDGHVCECCKPSVAIQGNNVFVMFRNWLQGNRDLYLVQSTNGGQTFGNAQKLGNGNWQLNACPMDGGGLAINDKGVAETVWRRENTIYACEPGKAEIALGIGKGCSIATVNNKNVYAWSAGGNITCLLPDGTAKVIGKGALPLLKSVSNDAVVCIWENNKQIESSVLHL